MITIKCPVLRPFAIFMAANTAVLRNGPQMGEMRNANTEHHEFRPRRDALRGVEDEFYCIFCLQAVTATAWVEQWLRVKEAPPQV